MPDGSESRCLRRLHTRYKLLAGGAEYMVIDTRLVADLPAEKLVHRHAKVLARNVPQRNINRADARHYRRAPEVPGAVHRLPVVLNKQRVLAD